jgi:hypothetical protein
MGPGPCRPAPSQHEVVFPPIAQPELEHLTEVLGQGDQTLPVPLADDDVHRSRQSHPPPARPGPDLQGFGDPETRVQDEPEEEVIAPAHALDGRAVRRLADPGAGGEGSDRLPSPGELSVFVLQVGHEERCGRDRSGYLADKPKRSHRSVVGGRRSRRPCGAPRGGWTISPRTSFGRRRGSKPASPSPPPPATGPRPHVRVVVVAGPRL